MNQRTAELIERVKNSKTLTQEEKNLYIEWQIMDSLAETDKVYKNYIIKRHRELVETGRLDDFIDALDKFRKEDTDESR